MSEETTKSESVGYDPDRPPPHWKSRYLLWLGAFLLILYIFEMQFRQSILSKTFGYEKTAEIASDRNIDFIFTGTSRTLHAVDDQIIIEEVSKALGKPFWGRNLSGGGNKIDNHYLGLRNLYKEHPEYLQGTLVFIESPAGLPEHMYWSDSWTFEDYKRNLVPNLRGQDMVPLFRSTTTLNTKLHLMINYLLYRWRSFESRYVLRHEFLAARSVDLQNFMVSIGGRMPVEEKIEGLDEHLGRNVRVDQDVKRNAERNLRNFIERNRDTLFRPWTDWEDTVINDIVELVHENGGQVVFFEAPQHSNYDQIYYDEIEGLDESLSMVRPEDREKFSRAADREAFKKYVEKTGCIYIEPNVKFTDEDFPDKFHVGMEQSQEFSKALAESIVNEVLKKE